MMLRVLHFVVRFLLAMVFLLSAASKAVNYNEIRLILYQYQLLSNWMVNIGLWPLIIVEFSIGLGLLLSPGVRQKSAAMGTVLLFLVSLLVGFEILVGAKHPCGCGMVIFTSDTLGGILLLRNALLMLGLYWIAVKPVSVVEAVHPEIIA